MKKISDYINYKHTLRSYDLYRVHRVFTKKKYRRKITLRKFIIYNQLNIFKMSDYFNRYGYTNKRINVEAVINYRAFSIEAMYGPEVEEEGNYFDDEK